MSFRFFAGVLKKRVKVISLSFSLSLISLGFLLSCGGINPEEAAGDSSTSAISGSGGGSSKQFEIVFPTELTFSVFPQDSSVSSSFSLLEKRGKTIAKKKQDLEQLIGGEASTCLAGILSLQPAPPSAVSCYEFDQEMLYGDNPSPGETYYGTQNGKDAAGEACLISFARWKNFEVEQLIDMSLGIVASMLCLAKKSGQYSLPSSGSEIDLSTLLASDLSSVAKNISEAKIKRLSDSENRPVFQSKIKWTLQNGETQELNLVHRPKSETSNSEYDGVLWTISKSSNNQDSSQPSQPFKYEGLGSKSFEIQNTQNLSDQYLSIQYKKSLEAEKPILRAELRRARLNSVLASNAFNKYGVLDLNVGTDSSGNYIDPQTNKAFQQQNDAISGISYIALKRNTEDDTGILSYWENPGANYSENARGMIFELNRDESGGGLKGCGLSGATGSNASSNLSIRKAIKEGKENLLSPKGFYHPFLNTMDAGQGENSCTQTTGTDTKGDYYSKSCSGGGGGQTNSAKWYKPKTTGLDASLLSTWTTAQTGSIVSRQCVKQDATSGVYEIDVAQVSAEAGFELLDSSSDSFSSKNISVPDLSIPLFEVNN